LHLDDAIAVAKGEPYDMALHAVLPDHADARLVDGPHFRLDSIDGIPDETTGRRYHGCLLVIPREGTAYVEGEPMKPGQCALAHSIDDVVFDRDGACLIAQPMRRD
jgi:mannose-6-phosphate isomerase